MDSMRTLSPMLARRLAISRQRLAGPRPRAERAGVLEVVRDLGCLQIDPISVVARSHQLVLWSRLGPYDLALLDDLLWKDRLWFEYWAHAASIVLTEDYPIHSVMMRNHAASSAWDRRAYEWVEANQALRDEILGRLDERGPLPIRDFEDKSADGWRSSGWSDGRNVERMLGFLWMRGQVLVARRSGLQKYWDLAERCLPDWTPRDVLSEREATYHAAQKSLRALGVAQPKHIARHFTRGRYVDLPSVLSQLEAEGRIVRVRIYGDESESRRWAGTWYVHAEDLLLLDRLAAGKWEPRTTLLSPFDNLICDRARTKTLFNFDFSIEIYVPRAKRQYGYYVLSILHGDRLIGRIDPAMDRKRLRLNIRAVHAEPDAPMTEDIARAVAGAVEELAAFLGAKDIAYPEQVPEGWKQVLH